MPTNYFRLFLSLVLVFILLMIAPAHQPARAAGPWYVSTTGDDSNDCTSASNPCATINGAIGKAAAGDTIRVSIGMYSDGIDEVVLIDKSVILSGGWNGDFSAQTGNSVIDGQGARRGVLITNEGVATIDHFTIQNGFVTFTEGGGIRINGGTLTLSNSTVSGNSAGYAGSGIANLSGTLTVTDSLVTNNAGSFGGDYGGGIYTYNGFGGSLSVINSTISFNRAESGGGIFGVDAVITINHSSIHNNEAAGVIASGGGIRSGFSTLTITNSSITDNLVTGTSAGQNTFGGGIMAFDGISNITNSTIGGNRVTAPTGATTYGGGIANFRSSTSEGALFLNNTTIAENQSMEGGGIAVPESFYGMATVTLQNTIVDHNVAPTGANCRGTLVTSGYNLIGDLSNCDFAASSTDVTGADSLVGALQNNGDSTFTNALLPGSAAIDGGNPSGCTDQDGNPLTTDQRGVSRPQGARCDIGAFELEALDGGGNEISIDIKPGSDTNPINMRSRGWIPVAILSTPDFRALSLVDRSSLTFGSTGDELSLASCGRSGKDVNGDGLRDLVCHFRTQLTGFQLDDTQATLKGKSLEGQAIKGSDVVRILK